ncbi:MAG: hypothetical protein WC223_01640 [Bacteroidales bacterium]|jgi:hypothetical protein
MVLTETDDIKKKLLFKIAYSLSIFTVAYNIIEGLVSTYFGFVDDTLTLFGFGVDSFIEAISAIGIAYMILQIKRNAYNTKSRFEKTALRITGYSFYILSAGLLSFKEGRECFEKAKSDKPCTCGCNKNY